ncbi:phosphate ABC transporter permease PstA [Gimibacter soli]|uniref:Phosphate transport system permease protein PstA n=1 Tax=Gimibacter soli TaxID=3024400 RepID=A0AAE9XKU0_9PROT|nr:phosphate ABC transporter permease PstA [Gimibacter soli]WCL53014.1 phosphate ABC transporter permease PstA [Gimibacter soli]
MTTPSKIDSNPTVWDSKEMQQRTARRYRQERIFRAAGLGAVAVSALFLVVLLSNIISQGTGGFFQTYIETEIELPVKVLGDPRTMTPEEFANSVRRANMLGLVAKSLEETFPDVTSRNEKRALLKIYSTGVRGQLAQFVTENPDVIGTRQTLWLLASDDIDQVVKGNIDTETDESDRRVSDRELAWLQTLEDAGRVDVKFHTTFLTSGDSRNPEMAGVWGAVVGSALTLFVTLILAFPVGVLSAIYLEEFAPQNRFTDFLEININNLAAVPSIVFGLLGLAVFIGTMHLPRSAPLVGGFTLALMTLPTIIIASRAAIKAVPPSIRDAARGLGASPMQVIFHHVLPLAMPGILTGTIIGMAQALGETAPLLMIGMVAFIVDIPSGITGAATALPVQVYLWADSPERAFAEKTSAAIMVLLFFLIMMNAVAIKLRQKFERKW